MLKEQKDHTNQLMAQEMKLIRQQAGFTVRKLANELGTANSFAGKIEGCERRLDVGEFIVYCQTLNQDPVEVLRKIIQLSADNPLEPKDMKKTKTTSAN